MARNLGRDELGRVWIAREHPQSFLAVTLVPIVKRVAHHHLLACRVEFRLEDVRGVAPRLPYRPPGKAFRHLDHILLRVAGVYTDRVQLHHLAAVVFIDAALRLLWTLVGYTA